MENYNQQPWNVQNKYNKTQDDFFNTQEPKFNNVQPKQDRQYRPVQREQPKIQERKRDVSHDIFGFQSKQQKTNVKRLNRDIAQETFDGDKNFISPKSPLNLSQQNDNNSEKSWNSKRSQKSRRSFKENNPLMQPVSQMANKSLSNISQRSNISRRDRFIEDLTSDPYQLKAQIKSLDQEIRQLKNKINDFNETGNSAYKNPAQNKQDEDLLKINRLEVELINQKLSTKKMEKKKEKLLKYQQTQTQSYDDYMRQMKNKFEENIEKNKETMTAELSFKYNNNDEETINYLKRLLKSFEKEKKILGIPIKRQLFKIIIYENFLKLFNTFFGYLFKSIIYQDF